MFEDVYSAVDCALGAIELIFNYSDDTADLSFFDNSIMDFLDFFEKVLNLVLVEMEKRTVLNG